MGVLCVVKHTCERFAQGENGLPHLRRSLVTLGNYGGLAVWISCVFCSVLFCSVWLSSLPLHQDYPPPAPSSEIHPLLPGIQKPFPTHLPLLTSSLSVPCQGHTKLPESHFYPVIFLRNSFLMKMIITIIMQ